MVGFAAETDAIVERAQAKLVQKRVDLIVANDVSRPESGFDVDTNEVVFVSADGVEAVPLLSKTGVAQRILDRVEHLLAGRTVPAS